MRDPHPIVNKWVGYGRFTKMGSRMESWKRMWIKQKRIKVTEDTGYPGVLLYIIKLKWVSKNRVDVTIYYKFNPVGENGDHGTSEGWVLHSMHNKQDQWIVIGGQQLFAAG